MGSGKLGTITDMIAGRIEGATRVLEAPSTWDRAKNGPCAGLAIKDEVLPSGQKYMVSVWHPTAEEILLIEAGAPVKLWLAGNIHPLVDVGVGKAPRDG